MTTKQPEEELSQETVNAVGELADVLRGIRTRLAKEGIHIVNGKVVRDTNPEISE